MGFGGGSTSDVNDPRSGEATYAGTGSRAGTVSRSSGANFRSGGPSTQRDDDNETTQQLAERVAAARAAEQAAVMQQVEEARSSQAAGGPIRMGLVEGQTFAVPGPNFVNAQLMRPFSFTPNLTMSMMAPSGVRGMGLIPKAPVYNPLTNTYTVDGKVVDNATAEYMMEVRGDVYDALPDPSRGVIGGALDKVRSLFGQEPGGFNDYGTLLSMDGVIDPETGNVSAPVGRGTLNYDNRLGIVTYSGPHDPTYSGPYENLVRGPFNYDGDDGDDRLPGVPVAAVTGAAPETPRAAPQYIYPEGGFFPKTGRYYRRGLLDIDPGGLLDFTARNEAFRRGMATDASLYGMPYDLSGYTLL